MRSVVIGIVAFIASIVITFTMFCVEAQIPASPLVGTLLPLTDTPSPTNTPTAMPAVTTVDELTAAAVSEVNDFMSALIAKDYVKAFQMIHPSQQIAFGGSPLAMRLVLEAKGLEATSFTLTNIHVDLDA